MKSDEVCACACACIPHICIQTYRHATHTYICAFALAGDMWQQKPCLRLTWPAVVVWLRSVRPSYRPPALRPSVSVWGIEAFNLIFVQVRFTYHLPFPPVPFALCVCVWDYVHIEQVCETGRRNYGKFVLSLALLVALNLSCCQGCHTSARPHVAL